MFYISPLLFVNPVSNHPVLVTEPLTQDNVVFFSPDHIWPYLEAPRVLVSRPRAWSPHICSTCCNAQDPQLQNCHPTSAAPRFSNPDSDLALGKYKVRQELNEKGRSFQSGEKNPES